MLLSASLSLIPGLSLAPSSPSLFLSILDLLRCVFSLFQTLLVLLWPFTPPSLCLSLSLSLSISLSPAFSITQVLGAQRGAGKDYGHGGGKKPVSAGVSILTWDRHNNNQSSSQHAAPPHAVQAPRPQDPACTKLSIVVPARKAPVSETHRRAEIM